MKILMATMGLDIGGAETHIVELSKELKSRGHQVAVVSNGGVYVPEIEAAGIRHYAAPLNRRSVGSMLQAQRILRQVIAREKPDIVHAHARIPAFLCGRLQKSMGFAFVTSCHGVYQVSGALRLLSNWGERTLAVSEDIRDYLIRQYNVPQEHITLTINGIDTDKFSPALTGETVRREFDLGDGPVIAHVSRLDPETVYTARQLVELAPALCRDYPGLHILIVGGGGAFEPLKAQAEEVNRKLGRQCVILTGPRTDVNQLVAACGLFVGVSRAALEAMAACKPVVLPGPRGTPACLGRSFWRRRWTPTSAAAPTLCPPRSSSGPTFCGRWPSPLTGPGSWGTMAAGWCRSATPSTAWPTTAWRYTTRCAAPSMW